MATRAAEPDEWRVVHVDGRHFVVESQGREIAEGPQGDVLEYFVKCANQGRRERLIEHDIRRVAEAAVRELYGPVLEAVRRASKHGEDCRSELSSAIGIVEIIERESRR